MDESTFEMFDDELGTPLQDVPQQKPFRPARRTGTETYVQRRVREEPPIVQQIPKAVPREAPISRAMPLRKAVSIQNIAQIDIPWEGVTLNRCLIIAITILVVTSGFQRLGEAIRGRKDGSDVNAIDTALNVRHTAVRKGRLAPPPQPEASLWDTFWGWVSDDDDDDDKRGKRGKSRKGAQESSTRGLRHKAIPNRNLLKGRLDRFKARREKTRQQDEEDAKERVKAQRAKEKRLKQKKLEEEELEKQKPEKEEKIQKKKKKEGKKKDKDRKE